MDRISQSLKKNAQDTIKLVDAVNKDHNTQLQYLNNLSVTTLNLLHIVETMTSYLTELLSACESLLNNQLPSFIIHGDILSQTIEHITEKLHYQGHGLQLVHSHPSFYYKHGNFIFLRNKNTLFITLQFPVTNIPEEFDVYSVHAVPMSLPGQEQNALQLLDLPAAIAIQKGMSLYFNMTEKQFKSLIAEHYATPQRILNDNKQETCLMAIFRNDQVNIMRLCHFEIQLGAQSGKVYPLEQSKFYLFNVTNYMLTCNSKLEIKDGCAACTITIPTGCSFHLDDIFVPPIFNENLTSEVEHIVNAPLLAMFFPTEAFELLQGETKFKDPIDITIPAFQYFNHSYMDEIAGDQQMNINFKKAVAAVKKSDVIIRHMPDAIALSKIEIGQDNIFWETTAGYLVIALGIVVVMLTLNCCYLLYRMRMLTIMVLLLKQNMVQVTARSTSPPIPRDIFVFTTPTYPTTTMDLHSQLASYSDGMDFTLLFIIMTAGIFAYILRTVYRQTCRHISLDNKAALKLEILSGQKSATLLIQMFNGKPDTYLIRPPSIKPTLEISGFWSPLLAFDWNDATAISEETSQHYPFPPLVHTSILTGLFIRLLIRQTYTMNLFWESNQERYNIPTQSTKSRMDATGDNRTPRRSRRSPQEHARTRPQQPVTTYATITPAPPLSHP